MAQSNHVVLTHYTQRNRKLQGEIRTPNLLVQLFMFKSIVYKRMRLELDGYVWGWTLSVYHQLRALQISFSMCCKECFYIG